MSKYNQSTAISRRLLLTKQQKQGSYTFSKSSRFNYAKKTKSILKKEAEFFEEEEQDENQKLKRQIKIVLNRCFVEQEYPQLKKPYIPQQEQSTHEKCKIVPEIEKIIFPKSARSTISSGRRIHTEGSFDQRNPHINRENKSLSIMPYIVDFSKFKTPISKIKAYLSTSPSSNNDKEEQMPLTSRTAPSASSASPNVIISAVYTRRN